jgi:hypothetical protein
MFKWFENLVNPFPSQAINATPKNFWAFAWECTQGLRPYILAMTLLTAVIVIVCHDGQGGGLAEQGATGTVVGARRESTVMAGWCINIQHCIYRLTNFI